MLFRRFVGKARRHKIRETLQQTNAKYKNIPIMSQSPPMSQWNPKGPKAESPSEKLSHPTPSPITWLTTFFGHPQYRTRDEIQTPGVLAVRAVMASPVAPAIGLGPPPITPLSSSLRLFLPSSVPSSPPFSHIQSLPFPHIQSASLRGAFQGRGGEGGNLPLIRSFETPRVGGFWYKLPT